MVDEKKAVPVGKIFKQIPLIMADIKAIGKEQKSKGLGFQYRGIDDVYNELQQHLSKHKVFSVPLVLNQKEGVWKTANDKSMMHRLLTVQYTFYAEDGSSFEAVVMGEAMDTGDKAASKAMAIAHKYALFQIFCIPTDDMPDPDAESREASRSQNGSSSQNGSGDTKRSAIPVEINVDGKLIGIDYYQVLKMFQSAKAEMIKVGGEKKGLAAYKAVLGDHGYEKSNLVPKDKMNQVFQDMKEAYRNLRDEAAEDAGESESAEPKEAPKTVEPGEKKYTTSGKKGAGGDGQIPF